MRKKFVYTKEILFIFLAMLTPLVIWLAVNIIKLTVVANDVKLNSNVGELIEGFILTTLILVMPVALLFWLLLKIFHSRKNIEGKAKILLASIAAGTIIGTLFIFNLTSTPEWFALIAVPIGILVFKIISKRESDPQEDK